MSAREVERVTSRILLAIMGGGFDLVRRDGQPVTEVDHARLARRVDDQVRFEVRQLVKLVREAASRPQAANVLGPVALLLVADAIEQTFDASLCASEAPPITSDSRKPFKPIAEWTDAEAAEVFGERDGTDPDCGEPTPRKGGAR